MSTETITVLFTDLVGSTALLSRVGAARADVLRREHFAMLRQAIARTRGREIKNLGDGLMVAFGSVVGALDAAVLMQKGLRRSNADGSLLMRVGISHGEADAEAGDYFGRPVIEAARLCAAADDGQILTTEIVRMLAGSRTFHVFEGIDEIELKGFTEPIAACIVQWDTSVDELRSTIPLPRRLESPTSTILIGRDDERMALLNAWYLSAATNRCGTAFIAGDAGIGKTALLADVARSVYAEDGVVLYGRCDEDLSIPYQPWTEALRHLIAHAPDSMVGSIAPELARLVPAASSGDAKPHQSLDIDADAERYVLFASVVELLATVSAKSAVLLLLDDLHWADGPTLQLLRYLALSDVPMRVQIIGSYRDSETSTKPTLIDLLAALRRENATQQVALHGLSEVQVLTLVEDFVGHELGDDELVLRDALVRETDGNPFFVAEMLRHLAETGAIAEHQGRWIVERDLATIDLPASIREVIERRVARLGERAANVLGAASVIGRDFVLPMVASLTDVDEDIVLDTLERAVGADLLRDIGGERFAFAHALIEHAMYDGLGATRRARLHRRAAQYIEDETNGDPGGRIGELAQHWSEGAGSVDAARACDWQCKAGDHALGRLAPEEARRWYLRAEEFYAKYTLHDHHSRCRILLGLGQAQRQLGDAAHRQTLLDAANLADQLGATPLLVRAALANNRGWFSAAGTIDQERVDVLRRAIAQVGSSDNQSRASLLALLSLELSSLGPDPTERRLLADEATALARSSGNQKTLLHVLHLVYVTKSAADTHEERQAIAREALALARIAGDDLSEFWANVCMLNTWAEASYVFRPLLDRCAEIAERIGQPTMRWMITWLECCDASRLGNMQRADDLAGAALRIALEAGEPDAMAVYGTQIAVLRWMQGRRAELVPVLTAVKPELERLASFRAMFAAAHLDAGDESLAASLLNAELQVLPRQPADLQWLCTALTWCDVSYRLGDQRASGVLAAILQPFAVLFGFDGGSLYGSVADALARLAFTTADYDAAQTYLDIADELNARFDAPFFSARTRLHRAQMCTRRGATGDRDAARIHATDALEIAQRHGFADIERAAAQTV
jgi:class 3 adenylate cyclase